MDSFDHIHPRTILTLSLSSSLLLLVLYIGHRTEIHKGINGFISIALAHSLTLGSLWLA